MVKVLWYIISLFIILLISINSPINSNLGITINQTQLFGLRSNKIFVQQIIGFSIAIFLLLTIFLLL